MNQSPKLRYEKGMVEDWGEFFLLIGSAAAALIGLLFVVTTLMVGVAGDRAERANRLFLSPTVFHFAVVLTVSAACLTPHLHVHWVGAILAALSLLGMFYMVRDTMGLAKPGVVQDWTDFWFYGVAPLVCYGALAALAYAFFAAAPNAPYLLAALLVALLLTAIRNAWDLVTWIAPRIESLKQPEAPKLDDAKPAEPTPQESTSAKA